MRPRERGRADNVLSGTRADTVLIATSSRGVQACLKAKECVHRPTDPLPNVCVHILLLHGPTDPLPTVHSCMLSRAHRHSLCRSAMPFVSSLCLNVMPFISFHNTGSALPTKAGDAGFGWSCDESSRKPTASKHPHLP